jgi:hypothetical protein
MARARRVRKHASNRGRSQTGSYALTTWVEQTMS